MTWTHWAVVVGSIDASEEGKDAKKNKEKEKKEKQKTRADMVLPGSRRQKERRSTLSGAHAVSSSSYMGLR